MSLVLTKNESKLVAFSLRLLADEYRKAAGAIVTKLADGFLDDVNTAETLASKIESTHTTAYVEKEVLDIFKREHNVIFAIKRYRELIGAGLKESKDAVEVIGLRAGLMEMVSDQYYPNQLRARLKS